MPKIEVEFSKKSELACLFISESDGAGKEGAAANDEVAYLPWRSADFVFTSMRPFFDSEPYSLSILKGLIISSGGLTESTLKAS